MLSSNSSLITSIKAIAINTLFIYSPFAFAGIQGSVHDLSARGITNEICNVCHTPHAKIDSAPAPLWNHEVTTTVFTLYDSPTMDFPAEPLGPGSPSRLCLSCHDGTISIDAFGGNPGTPDNKLTGEFSKGTDLRDDHPVGMLWKHQTLDDLTSAFCSNCHDISNPNVPYGKELRFFNGKVECPSCHDVHNNQVMDVKLLRKPLAGSQLCLHCHAK